MFNMTKDMWIEHCSVREKHQNGSLRTLNRPSGVDIRDSLQVQQPKAKMDLLRAYKKKRRRNNIFKDRRLSAEEPVGRCYLNAPPSIPNDPLRTEQMVGNNSSISTSISGRRWCNRPVFYSSWHLCSQELFTSFPFWHC